MADISTLNGYNLKDAAARSGKADKVASATNGNFAGLDSNGNLTDSGNKASDFLTQHQDISGKADKVAGATNGNFAGLDSNGNLTDSGSKASDFLTSHQDISGKQDKALTTSVEGQSTVEGALGALSSNKVSIKLLEDTVGWTSENLFNRDTCTEGYIINVNGVVTESSSGYYSDYISVVKSLCTLKYKETGSTHNIRVHEYDSSKTWLRQLAVIVTVSNSDGAVNLQISDDAKYIRISAIDSITNISFYHASVDSCKAETSVISEYVEDSDTCKNPNGYSVGQHFQKNGKFCTCIANTAQNETWTLNTNYVEGTIADAIKTVESEVTLVSQNITLDNTFKRVIKSGKTVEFQVRFTVNNALSGDEHLFNIGYANYSNVYIFLPIFNRNAPYEILTSISAFVNPDGHVHTTDSLPTGTYVICGCFITKN